MSTDQRLPSQTNRDCERSEIGAPRVTRLFNQPGRVDRRTVLRAATTGVIGTILGASQRTPQDCFRA
jgi:thiocyanate desulfurase